MKLPRPGKKPLVLLMLFASVLSLSWWQKAHWLGRYYVWKMSRAEDTDPWDRSPCRPRRSVADASLCSAADTRTSDCGPHGPGPPRQFLGRQQSTYQPTPC